MLAEVFVWWAAQMRSLLPGRFVKADQPQDAVIVAIDALGDGAELDDVTATGTILIRRAGHETALQALNLERRQPLIVDTKLATGLRMPRDTVLHREIVLPLAAERDLRAVIGFEMDRVTPFAAEEVFWGISGLARDRARGKLSLHLAIVPRSPVERLLTALGHLKLAPAFIECETGRIELAASHRVPGGRRQAALCGLCGALALACIVVPFIRQQIALDGTAQTITRLTPAGHEALRLRQQLAIAASGQQVLAEARQAGDTLQVLAALTSALPDGTWLSDLTLKAGELTMDGQSSDAARLITLLSAAPGFHNPSFTAPVTRSIQGVADLFSIRAAVAE